MATFDYSKSANKALELITKFGTDASYRENLGSEIDPNKPYLGKNKNEVGSPCKAVLLPMSMREKSFYPDTLATKDLRKMLVEAVELDEDIEVGEKILFENEYWKIEAVKQLKPASTTVLWTLVVSR